MPSNVTASNPGPNTASKGKAKAPANTNTKSYTAPKGRPTVHPTRGARSRRLSARVEWALVILVSLIVLGAIFYFGRGLRSGGTGVTAPPIDEPSAAQVVPAAATALAAA